MFVADALKGLLRPSGCLACGAPAAWPCCADCLPSEPGTVGPWALAADPDLPLWTLGPYRDGLRAAVLAGKLDGQPAALTELGRRLGTALAEAGAGADLVTYIAAGRVAGPPRDHAERIATGVAAALDLPLAHLLAPAGGRDLGRARRATRASPATPSTPEGPPPPRRRPGPAGRRPHHHRRHPRHRSHHPPHGRCPPRRSRRPRRIPLRPPTPDVTRGARSPTRSNYRPARPDPIPARPPRRTGTGGSATLPRDPHLSRPDRSALLKEVALCGCDLFSCVESGQYDQWAMKEDGPRAE